MNQLDGVIHITGGHDSGKTTFALECGADPSRILFFDDDVKGRATITELQKAGVKFGRYVDMVNLAEKKTEYDFHTDMVKIIRGIKQDEFDAIIWDTWSSFAATCHSYVLKHPREFRENWAPMGTIKGAQQWQEARRYEAALVNYMAQRTKTLILITHLKDYYAGKVKVPGKQVPNSSNVLERIPRFRVWLRQNPNGRPVPVGLVLKRLDKKEFVAGTGIRTVSVLPRKLSPSVDDRSLWDTIWKYWDKPYGDREPTPDELPDDFEISILEGTLTKEQQRTFRMLIENDLVGESDVDISNQIDEEVVESVRRLKEEGKTAPLIAKELKLAMPTVLRAMEALSSPLEEEEEVKEAA